MLYKEKHGQALTSTARPSVLQSMHGKGEWILSLDKSADQMAEFGFPYCTVAIKRERFEDARAKLQKLLHKVGIEAPELDIQYYL